jgi:putative hemolysin
MSHPQMLAPPAAPHTTPTTTISSGRYEVRFARTPNELDQILRLRYEVFNLELNEGLDGSALSGRDEDEFDQRFDHLLIAERQSGAVVGTYRMQTAEMAAERGYYSAGLFELGMLPEAVRRAAVEIGRACVAKPHRNGRVLHLLWRGLAAYLTWNRKTMLFGCCSLTSQDESLGLAMHRHLEEQGHVHPRIRVNPRPDHACLGEDRSPPSARNSPRIPALFHAYLTLGARALGCPAIDREFKTIDWIVLLDTAELPALVRRSMFR